MKPKSLSVLHLPTTVGGHAWGLSQGERANGVNAKVMALYGNYLDYEIDTSLQLERRGVFGRVAGHIAAVARYRKGYDAYHFNYGSSIFHFLRRGVLHLDLPFFDKSARKIFTYNGCDARQKDMTMARERAAHGDRAIAACFNPDCYGGLCNSGVVDKNRRRAIEKAQLYADHIFALNPDLLHFLPREKSSFLPYAMSNFRQLGERRKTSAGNTRLRIAHAPTDRGAKGTPYILTALEKLADRYPDAVEMLLIEGRTNADALDLLATADLVVDQVLIGWYGGLAVEAMKMGIPVACFLNEDHFHFLPPGMAGDLPIVRITPFDIFDVLNKLVRDREQLADIAVKSVRYVDTWHDPEKVALTTIAAYHGRSLPLAGKHN